MSDVEQSSLFASLRHHHLVHSYFHCCYQAAGINRTTTRHFSALVSEFFTQAKWSTLQHQCSSLFTQLPAYTLYWAVKLFLLLRPHCEQLEVHRESCHTVAQFVSTQLRNRDQHLLFDLLANVVFHPDLFRPSPDLHLSTVRHLYLTSLKPSQKEVMTSQAWCLFEANSIESFYSASDDSSLLPVDWPFYPLLNIYDWATCAPTHKHAATEEETLSQIVTCLRFVRAIARSDLMLSGMTLRARLVRLMCVFLSGDGVFLHDHVSSLVKDLFSCYCDVTKASEIDFFLPIPGIVSFYDFYVSLLEQFKSVSYGDRLFAATLLLPLHQSSRHDNSKLKLALWKDYCDVIPSITLDCEQLLLPIELYLEPAEQSVDVLRSYVNSLLAGASSRRSPVMHRIAIHHVTRFVTDERTSSHDIAREQLSESIRRFGGRQLLEDVFGETT